MPMAPRFGEPVRHLPNGAAKLFHVEKIRSPKSRRESAGTVRGAGGLHDRGRNVPLDRRGASRTHHLMAHTFGGANSQTVAPPALGDTQQGKEAAP